MSERAAPKRSLGFPVKLIMAARTGLIDGGGACT